MKSLVTNLMLAAAALIVVAGSASAQGINAEIPFAFNANGVHMAPGTYLVSVRISAGLPVIQIVNAGSRASVFAGARPGHDAPKNWIVQAKPMLSFACAEQHCSLKAVWFGEGVSTLTVPAPKSDSVLAGVEIVNVRAMKAD